MFWFFNYEGHKNSEPLPTYTTVPTIKERTGDFSELLALGPTYQLYDPDSGTFPHGVVKRSPYAGNIIPMQPLEPGGAEVPGLYSGPQFQLRH